MNIKIKGTDIEVTQAISEYVTKKVGEALEKFNKDGNVFSEVELSKTNNHHSHGELYKVSVKVSGTHINIFLDTKKDDLYAAIDEIKDKLEYRISTIKDKKTSISRKLAVKFKNLFRKGE
jgi:ribosomal subunit interface protein